jgi:hypothetical protein
LGGKFGGEPLDAGERFEQLEMRSVSMSAMRRLRFGRNTTSPSAANASWLRATGFAKRRVRWSLVFLRQGARRSSPRIIIARIRAAARSKPSA